MDYKQIYENFISSRKGKDAGLYKERHHILPKSIGGTDAQNNLIDLSARDHYFAHRLLEKIYGGKMSIALQFMVDGSTQNQQRYKPSSRTVGYAREQARVAQLEYYKSEDGIRHKRKVSEVMTNKDVSEDTRQKISEKMKGNVPWNKGKKLEEERYKTGGRKNKGKEPWNKGITGKEYQDRFPNNSKPPSQKGKKWINKNGVGKKVPKEDLQVWLDNGWNVGRHDKIWNKK